MAILNEAYPSSFLVHYNANLRVHVHGLGVLLNESRHIYAVLQVTYFPVISSNGLTHESVVMPELYISVTSY